MALLFLDLVNDVNRRLNEVPLTSGNFNGALGFYSDVKGYVNSSLNRINREEFEWPFNHGTVNLPLVVNQTRYDFPTDTKSVAFDTFRVKGNDTFNNESRKLSIIDYEEFLENFSDQEVNPDRWADEPEMVFRGRGSFFGIVPPPDNAYEVVYEYYRLPTDLTNWDDSSSIPDQYRWVILEGAMYHAYMFRGALEEAAISDNLFKSGIKDMRKLYINRYEYVRPSVIRS